MSSRKLRVRLRRSKRLSHPVLLPSPEKKSVKKRICKNVSKKSIPDFLKKSAKCYVSNSTTRKVSKSKNVSYSQNHKNSSIICNTTAVSNKRKSSLSQISKRMNVKENTSNVKDLNEKLLSPKIKTTKKKSSFSATIGPKKCILSNNDHTLNKEMNEVFVKKTQKTRKRVPKIVSLPCTPLNYMSLRRKKASLKNLQLEEISLKKKNKICKSTSLPLISNSQKSNSICNMSSRQEKLRNIPLDDLVFVKSSVKNNFGSVFTTDEVFKRVGSCRKENKKNSQNKKKNIQENTSLDAITQSVFMIPETKNKKRPSKNSLKHKRWIIDNINANSSGHEDDILENFRFTPSRNCVEPDTESEVSWEIATPKCGFLLSPLLPKRTPAFKDCYSPTELKQSRKNAEQFMYRNKKKKLSTDTHKEVSSNTTVEKSLEKEQILQLLSTPVQKKKQKQITDEFLADEEDSYDEEDEY